MMTLNKATELHNQIGRAWVLKSDKTGGKGEGTKAIDHLIKKGWLETRVITNPKTKRENIQIRSKAVNI